MQGPHWTGQGVDHLRTAMLVYTGVFGAFGLRRDWLVPGLAAVAVLGVAACGQWMALAAVPVILLACRAVGDWAGLRGVVAVAFGLAVMQTAIAMTVWLPVHFPAAYCAAIGLCLWLRRAFLLRWFAAWRLPSLDWPCYLALYPLGFLLCCQGLAALLPEVSSDGLTMHLVILDTLRYGHAWHFDVTRLSWAVMPMGGDWTLAPAFLLAGEAGARLMNFAVLGLTVALVWEVCRVWFPVQALLLAALFASTPLVLLVTGSLFVENVWALFVTAGVVAAARERPGAAAVLLGAACATKYGSWPAAVAVLALAGRWQSAGVRPWLIFPVFAAPPYVTAWVRTGNPVFPFWNGLFESPLFATAQSFADSRFQEPVRWDFLYRATVESHLFFEGRDGALGFQYLLGLPLALLAWRRWGRWEVLPAVVLAATVAGLAVSQRNLRYLYPALPGATFLLACAWRQVRGQRWPFGLAIALLVANLTYLSNSGWHHRDFGPWPWRAAEVASYREREAPARTLIAYLNALHPGEGVIYVASGQTAGLHAPAYVHSWHQYPFHVRAASCRSGREWRALAGERRAHWVVARADGAHEPAVREFLREYARPELTVGELTLFAIVR